MKYFFKNYAIQSFNFNNNYDFEKWHSNNQNILFIENDDCYQYFMCITLIDVTAECSLKLSFSYDNDVQLIKLFIDSNGNNLFIYTDGIVYVISIKRRKLVYNYKLNDPVLNVFYELDDSVLLIGEISVSMFCNSTIVWGIQTDLITKYKVENHFIYLDFLDSQSLKLDIPSGCIVD